MKLTGFVNSTEDFTEQPKVINRGRSIDVGVGIDVGVDVGVGLGLGVGVGLDRWHRDHRCDGVRMFLAVGFTAAFISGLVACTWMISLVKKSQLRYFSYYCFVVGFGAILATLFL